MARARSDARFETIDRVKLHFDLNLNIKQRHPPPSPSIPSTQKRAKLMSRSSRIVEEDSKDCLDSSAAHSQPPSRRSSARRPSNRPGGLETIHS